MFDIKPTLGLVNTEVWSGDKASHLSEHEQSFFCLVQTANTSLHVSMSVWLDNNCIVLKYQIHLHNNEHVEFKYKWTVIIMAFHYRDCNVH